MGADLRTPYHYARDAGYTKDEVNDIRDVLGGNEWYELPMQCTPKTLAAGAVYFLSKTKAEWPQQTQKDVAKKFDTTTMSVRNGWKHLAIHHGILDRDEVSLPHE